MITSIREKLVSRLLWWSSNLRRASETNILDRNALSIMVLFHGCSAVHTRRACEIAQQLRCRGYEVRLAGDGPYAEQCSQKSEEVCSVKTLPLEIHRDQIELSDYRSCATEWIDSCVKSERSLIEKYKPDLIIHSLKPTASIAAHLEGIDEVEIIQGYDRIGHSIPSQPLSVLSSRDTFAEYLKNKACEIKKKNKYYLIADIPELYPMLDFGADGFYYIGPVLPTTDKKRGRRKMLSKQDKSFPVVYIKDPRNLLREDVLRQNTSGMEIPYRLLVESTRGVKQSDSHAEFVNEIYRDPPWERIHIIVGDLDIETLYSALLHGVLPIGIATTLDQELQLDRLEAVSLGLKIDPDRFNYHNITQILGRTLDVWDKIEIQLESMANLLKRWCEKDVIADWVDDYFLNRYTALRYDPKFLVSENEFLQQLDGTTPATLSVESLREMLRQGIKKGIPHWRQGNQYFFDRIDSWNWLYEREARFFEAEYKACDQRRRVFFDIDETGNIRSKSHTQRYKITYSYDIHLTEKPDQQLRAFIPYPLETEEQKAVNLIDCFPENMRYCLRSKFGFFYAYPFTVTSNSANFSYTCELEVSEYNAEGRGEYILSDWERSKYLYTDEILGKLPELEQVLSEILEASAPCDKKELAWAFYSKLIRTKKFRKTKVPAMGLADSSAILLNNIGGNCIHFARTFIALCRMVGIPARERCGTLLGFPISEQVYEYRSIDEPMVGHTWAEIYLEESGWIPVEFLSMAIGEVSINEYNVEDLKLKTYIKRNTRSFDSYYFGHLDNQRLMFSNSAKTLPSCLIEGKDGWDYIPNLKCQYHLRVECI